MRKRSLFGQIYPSYVGVIALCVAALSLMGTRAMRNFVYGSTEATLSDLAVVAERIFFPEDGRIPAAPEDWDRLIEAYFNDRPFRLTVMDADGRVLADSKAAAADLENHGARPEVMAALSRGRGTAVRKSESVGVELYYLARPVYREGKSIAVIRASMPITVLKERLLELYGSVALGAALILAAAALIALAVVRRIGKPIRLLVGTAELFAEGQLNQSSHISAPEELRILGDTMNAMAAELRLKMDESERRRREAEAILAGLNEGVIVLDRNLTVKEANAAALAIFGIGEGGTVVGRSLLEAFRATELGRYARSALEGAGAVEGTITLWSQGQRTLQVYGAVIAGGQGCLLVVHDMTRLMQLERVRRDFVANVSHELKTPITSIKGFVETLQDGALDDPERAQRYLGIVAKHADRLERIIEDLLALARLEQQDETALETQDALLGDMLRDACALCEGAAAEKNISVRMDCPPELRCRANPSILEQAFVNLLDNAVKYSDRGKTVQIRAIGTESGAEIRFIDEGRGIPAADLPRIFERFYRVDKARSRDVGGTGLGLSIVKHVVSLHGGTVSVESREGLGSTFIVRLP